MDANKTPGIEGFSELFNGLPQHEAPSSDVQAGVVICSLNPLNFFNVDERIFRAVWYNEAFGKFARRRAAIAECGQRDFQLFLRQEGGSRCDFSLRPL